MPVQSINGVGPHSPSSANAGANAVPLIGTMSARTVVPSSFRRGATVEDCHSFIHNRHLALFWCEDLLSPQNVEIKEELGRWSPNPHNSRAAVGIDMATAIALAFGRKYLTLHKASLKALTFCRDGDRKRRLFSPFTFHFHYTVCS